MIYTLKLTLKTKLTNWKAFKLFTNHSKRRNTKKQQLKDCFTNHKLFHPLFTYNFYHNLYIVMFFEYSWKNSDQ